VRIGGQSGKLTKLRKKGRCMKSRRKVTTTEGQSGPLGLGGLLSLVATAVKTTKEKGRGR